ncbi:MAG TPA: histidine kinase [Gemmatimonadaceae bacterium]|jgi:PAS domain S-box-containing protein|nr:histidine kinase [Gemmatimonadaceae bacterium]
MPLSPEGLRELFFAQSIDGFFIMMIDEPIEWNDAADKDALLAYVFQHQRITLANEAYARHYNVPLAEIIGKTPEEFFAHDLERGKAGWRAMFDAGHSHVETDERRMDGTPVRIEGHYLCAYDDRGRITGHMGIQRDITDRHRSAEEIAQSREELRALAARLETVREEERTRIARELHDELGQALTGLKLDLAWMERRLPRQASPELAGRCASLLARLDEVMISVRRIITELRPSVLDQLGLADAIEWQAHDFAARTGVALDLDIDGNCPTPPDTVASAVFRMLQEALNNVAKHAKASRVRVAFHMDADSLSLDVADDGRGITHDELRGSHSLGLLGLRERALTLGGTVTIGGDPMTGTHVALQLPLPRASHIQ